MSDNHEQPSADPLIDEIRAIRKKISDQFGNDVERLGKHLQDVQLESQHRLVTREQLDSQRRQDCRKSA